MKLLNGSDLASYIKERQYRQVSSLHGKGIQPKLVILQVKDDPVIDTYVRLKKKYGEDIGVEVEALKVKQEDLLEKINKYNKDSKVHGIIIQLPLLDNTNIESVLNTVELKKDVDGLAKGSSFDSAAATAILWLLSGYNIEPRGKDIVIVGKGRLVGAPLSRALTNSGIDHLVMEEDTFDKSKLKEADIVISAVGKPGIIQSEDVKDGAVLVDAGVAMDKGVVKGDIEDSIYERQDISITPKKGGVGPLTVCALFENVLRAAESS